MPKGLSGPKVLGKYNLLLAHWIPWRMGVIFWCAQTQVASFDALTLEGGSNSLTESWLDKLMLEQSNESEVKTVLFVPYSPYSCPPWRAQGMLELLFHGFKAQSSTVYHSVSWGDDNPQIPEPQDDNLKLHRIDSLDRATLARTKN